MAKCDTRLTHSTEDGSRRLCRRVGHISVVNEAHLERILRTYVRHYYDHRSHQGLSQEIPNPENAVPLLAIEGISGYRHGHRRIRTGRIRRHNRLGGLIHEYERVARGADQVFG